MLALAGETCDGIVFTGGVEPQRVRRALDEVAAAAVAAGRDPAGIQCWQLLRTSVRDDADHALDDIKPLLSSAFHNLRGDDPTIPDRVRPALSRMAERYDARQHVKPGPNVNVDLMEDLGLTEYLASRFGVYGTPASVADQLRSLAEAGVSRFIVPDVGALDPMITIRRFGLEVMPLCRGPAGLDDCRGRR
jgi:alkanesulfonate monooxygenase SsuD/methylene tetrahydromethanopterin reductase-like flavin-dependent oxidoreductase (luciferase family)